MAKTEWSDICEMLHKTSEQNKNSRRAEWESKFTPWQQVELTASIRDTFPAVN